MDWSGAEGQRQVRSWARRVRRLALGLLVSGAALAAVLALPAKSAHASCDGGSFFTVTATAANTSGDMTTLDNYDLNGIPYLAPLVSQLWPSQYDPHPLGVWYDSYSARWTVFNEDLAPIPLGTSFTVANNCIGQEVGRTVTTITATSSNVSGASIVIDDPTTNGNPNAVVYATQDWTGTYNAHEIGVQYNFFIGRWTISNLDQSAMPVGASFDIWTGTTDANPNTLSVTASASNTVAGYMVYLNDAHFNNQPGLTPTVSQVFSCGWFSCGAVDNHPVGVWYNAGAGQWVIYNVDRASIPAGAQFFITPS